MPYNGEDNNDYVDGEVVQHIEYVPFGEVFIEERNNIWNTLIFSMRRNYSYRKKSKKITKVRIKMNNVWYIYCGGCVLLISCTFILFLLKKSRNRNVFWYFCHVWILCGITLGILNIVFQKYDAYTSIYLGIICSCYTYYDNKQNPVSKRTNAYISSLQGYVAGIGFLLYGLLSL